MSDLSETKFTCSICNKTLESYEIDVDTYNKNLDNISKYSKYILGIRCQNCDTGYCWKEHKNELKFRRWDGYEKTPCLQCGEPLGKSTIILRKTQELKKSDQELNNSKTSQSQEVKSGTEKSESSEISKKQSQMNKGKSYMTVGAVIFIIKLLISYTGMDDVMSSNYPNVLMICAAFFMLLGFGYFIVGGITNDKE